MTIKNKVFHLDSQFTKELPTAEEAIDSIFISGYASSTNVDRSNDVIPSSVWEAGIANYKKNPVILAYHDHDDPIGRMTEYKVDPQGLWIKARISAAAEVFNLIKDGILTAFSVGFRVLDAEYNSATELFVIKELELLEISVVSIPCNQDTVFSLSKAFDSEAEFTSFKSQFAPKSSSAKGLESSTEAKRTTLKEIGMDPKELEQMLANAASSAANAVLAAQAKEKAIAEQRAADELAMQDRINKAVAAVTPTTTGAEKLLADIEKRFTDANAAQAASLAGLEAALKEKATELAALQASKMTFGEANRNDGKVNYAEIEKAVLLSKITKKDIQDTKFGKELITKYAGSQPSPHLPNATWDTQVSLNMEDDVRRRLVIAGSFTRSVNMDQPVMKIPLNPDASGATWVTNTQYGASASAGATTLHQLSDITLSAYKLANNEYIAYESEEDSLIILLPLIRDAMVRRLARGVDKAMGLGAGAGSDPITGLAKYDAVSAVTLQVASTFSTAQLRALRKDLGAWGLDPSEVVFIVNTEAYYDLMEDTLFQTMDKVGDRATVLTGQVGMVGGSPVIVSAELPAKASGANTGGVLTNVGAIAFNPANFLVGNQRGVRFDTQDLVETQRKVLVGSLRTGMTQLTTANGQGVSAFRWLV